MFNFSAFTNQGKIPKLNQDAYSCFESYNKDVLFICIADGMGSQKGLDISSVIALEEFKNYMSTYLYNNDLMSIQIEMNKAIYIMNKVIYAYKKSNEELYGNFSSSFTICAITKNKEMLVAHIGDTRLYLFREGNLYQMTNDDTIAANLLNTNQITKEDYLKHPERHVLTKTLGVPNLPEVSYNNIMLYTNDVLLLLTKGVYEVVLDSDICEIFYNSQSPEHACSLIVDGASEVGGFDNATAIISFIDF